ncbi:NADP-dependent oxidoreductase [Nocardioides cynanchi]|uniref:NADP-dependent oxidoreductase n=1 Tax=Nocardioides cynanchi TaxID=2558918 RepID=UPI001246403C|nr:NADP-dependent oxidoreductase [Nocardioides cynanchi]
MERHWIAERPGGLEVFDLVPYDPPAPAAGEVTVRVRAAGVNPADAKHVKVGRAEDFPRGVGYEIAGVLTAVGPGTEIASGGGVVGDAVLAFRVRGGWATAITVPARDVFAKPASLSFEEAANLLLAATTASEMLHVTGVAPGETVVVHGASGAVGVSLLQQAARLGLRVLGTCSESRFDEVRRFGGEPVGYGPGLESRLRAAAPDGFDAALDCVGTEEAVDVSLSLVPDRDRIVTIAAKQRGAQVGIRVIGGDLPESAAYRDGVRAELVRLAGEGGLVVPMARTFPLEQALAAADLLAGGHPGGKVALIP